jgi:hypothetical protein
MGDDQLKALFPNLLRTGYEITSPKDRKYNCVAWALGHDDLVWWPDPSPFSYWPTRPRDASLEGFVRVFARRGFVVCDADDHDEDCDKIAIYALDSLPTHVARQIGPGLWSSKCGKDQDITHALGGLEGEEYGQVAVIMRRKRT